jgi:hypothetical protein
MRTCFYETNLIGLLYYDSLADVCIFYDLTFIYSVSLIYFFWAETAFDIFGTDNSEELLTCDFQYPSLPISILHFVARIVIFSGCNLNSPKNIAGQMTVLFFSGSNSFRS